MLVTIENLFGNSCWISCLCGYNNFTQEFQGSVAQTASLGNVLDVVVPANIGDRDGAKALLTKVERQIALEIVSVDPCQVGFAVQPRR